MLVCALAALVVGLAGGGGDDDAAAESRPAEPQGLSTIVEVGLGVRAGLPAGWRALRGAGPLRLSSPDGAVGVTVAVAGPAALGAEAARREVEVLVRDTYAPVALLRRGATRVAGRPARLAAYAGRTAAGRPVEILAATAASRWRTYAVLSFGAPDAPRERLAQARAVLESLSFRRPK